MYFTDYSVPISNILDEAFENLDKTQWEKLITVINKCIAEKQMTYTGVSLCK